MILQAYNATKRAKQEEIKNYDVGGGVRNCLPSHHLDAIRPGVLPSLFSPTFVIARLQTWMYDR
jgi:hypothetical protein